MEDVRLTIQIRDQKNKTRVSMHRDIPIAKAAGKAQELVAEASKMFRREVKATASDTNEK